MTGIVSDRYFPPAAVNPGDAPEPDQPKNNTLNDAPKPPSDDTPSPGDALIDGFTKSASRLRAALQTMSQNINDDDARDDARLAGHDLVARAKGLADSDVPMPQGFRDALRGDKPIGQVDGKPDAKDDAPGVRSPGSEPPPSTNSPDDDENGVGEDDDPTKWPDSKFWEKIAKLIGDLKENFLDYFQEAAKKYLDFTQALADIIAKLSSWIESKNDGKDVEVDVGKLKEALQKLLDKYKMPSKDGVLWPKQKDGDGEVEGGSKEDAEKWAKDMGLPDGSVVEQPPGSGKYVVAIDTGPIQSMIDSLPKGDANGKAKMTTQQLEIWRNGFTGQENQVKTTMQSLSQRYTTANANNENLVKVMSGAIASMSESAKGYFR